MAWNMKLGTVMISLRLNLTKVELEVMIHEVEVELEDIISKVFRPLKP